MSWTIYFSKNAAKQVQKLSVRVIAVLDLLVHDLRENGDLRHCHLIRGKPTYVCCWKIIDDHNIEVYYVGSHEKAPY